MDLKTFFGLPIHPLLVHLPVVLIPLAGILAVAFAIKPAWLDRFGWHLVVLSFVGAVGGVLAASSGEGLETLQHEAETAARENHFELGETARNLGLLFFLVVLGVVGARYLAKRYGGSSGIWAFVSSKLGATLMSLALVLTAAASTYAISKAGHQGAKLVWTEEKKKPKSVMTEPVMPVPSIQPLR